MDFNPWSMLLSTIFGLLLLFYPLVVTGPWRNFLVGASLTAVPWLAGKLGIDF